MANTNWTLEPSHSELHFKVKHMMISSVSGAFNNFDASIQAEENDFSSMQISFSGNIDSIDTKNKDRDAHLKSADFFDAASFPTMDFKSTAITKEGEDEYKVKGILTIKDVSHAVVLEAEGGQVINDPYGFERTGFELKGKIKRSEFGLKWNQMTETGGVIISDEVKIAANVEFIKQKEA